MRYLPSAKEKQMPSILFSEKDSSPNIFSHMAKDINIIFCLHLFVVKLPDVTLAHDHIFIKNGKKNDLFPFNDAPKIYS